MQYLCLCTDWGVAAAKEVPNSQAFTEFKGKFLEKLGTEITHTTDRIVRDALNKLERELSSPGNDDLLIRNLEGRGPLQCNRTIPMTSTSCTEWRRLYCAACLAA